MKKYMILRGNGGNSGIAVYDDRQKRLKINLDGGTLGKNEYFAVYSDGVCIGKTASHRAVFKADSLNGGIEIMKKTVGKEDASLEYTAEKEENEIAIVEKEPEAEETVPAKPVSVSEYAKNSFMWQKVRGYYCINGLEIVKHVMKSDELYESINKRGYYFFGEGENTFAIAAFPVRGKCPFSEDVVPYAKKIHIFGNSLYAVFMGADESGEYFLSAE